MYLYLGHKEQKIQDKIYYRLSILTNDDDNCEYSLARIYVLKTDNSYSKLSYYKKFDDITNDIGFKVRNDGKVVLTLK